MKINSKIPIIILLTILVLIPINTHASVPSKPINSYYGEGNYATMAPVKPTTGLKFHVGYNAINTYGSIFTSAFDWNQNYRYCTVHISTINQWPNSKHPDYFLIEAEDMAKYRKGGTYYYNSLGVLINDHMQYPMDYSAIYRCNIKINKDKSEFNINGIFSTRYLKKVIRHEVGHVLLLKHPSNQYAHSVMHQEIPRDNSQYSDVVTSTDIKNIEYLWYNK